ncbi:hypothetical protein [Noviherbaspirillum cavernae]|uniref:hypothetical protein n=1 Tax=Noviherbaspirillum cavernae TaxID=2320862 RepID=UPI001314C98B|nr:hypothetical protein [Noviherbaspirillum cavernae]
MNAFSVTVRTSDCRLAYTAIGQSSGAIHEVALDHFGGLCSVTVIPLKEGACQ